MDEELSPQEQQLLEDLEKNQLGFGEKKPSSINWSEGYSTEPGYDPSNRKPKKVNKEKLENFLAIFGGRIFSNAIDAIQAYLERTDKTQVDMQDIAQVSMADYILVFEAKTGYKFEDLPPVQQESILALYETLKFGDLNEVALEINETSDVLKNIYSKVGEIPGEAFEHIDDAVIGSAITSEYSTEADLTYKSYLTKQQYETEIRTVAAQAINSRDAQDFINQLEEGTITTEQYLEGIDNLIIASGEIEPDEFISIVENPGAYIPQEMFDPWLAGRIADPSQFGFIGIEEYDQEIYSSKEDGQLIPLYEMGMDRLLFASASPEEIAEVQNLLVEAGFLQPYSFAYGVVDFNQPEGGTLAALNSAMSRFNLNADTISKEDLYSILLAPGATSSNLISFVKEFFKDTLEDYGYGTGKFEPHSTVGYSQGYKELFQYQSPNLINAQSDIQVALERGLGRPVSSQEINSFVDYYNQVSYDLQKQNFETRQKNIQTQILGEETRYQNFLQGNTDFELPSLQETVDMQSAMSNAMTNYVRDQYGEAITGEDQQRAMQSTLISLLNTLGALSSYTSRG